jgi:DNA mismatch repair protein MutS
MAGVPKTVLYRAEEILQELEKDRARISGSQTLKTLKAPAQLNMFAVQDAAAEWIKQKLKTIDVNELTPIEGLMVLQQLKDQLKD